jgi:hypothetical protein
MLTFHVNQHTITINNATAQDLNNGAEFDTLYLDNKYRSTSMQAIHLYHNDILIRNVLLGASGGGTGVYEHTALIDGAQIVTCCCDTVFCLSITGLELLWKTKADLATCFAIYPYKQDYIVHGEVEISRIDRTGNIVWQNSGADIFVTLNGDSNLVLLEDTMVATDFEYSKYVFDYDGNTVSYTKTK